MNNTKLHQIWWNNLSIDQQQFYLLEEFAGTGMKLKDLTDRNIQGIYNKYSSMKQMENKETLMFFCTQCGINSTHTTSECPFEDVNELLNNTGAIG